MFDFGRLWMVLVLTLFFPIPRILFGQASTEPALHAEALDARWVLAKADTLDALISQCKPAIVWNGLDMLWVDNPLNGAVHFTAARAYFVTVGKDKPAWMVLHNFPGSADVAFPREWRGIGKYPMGDMTLVRKIPTDDAGAGDFAVELIKSERHGVLYEIGWESGPSGSGNYVEERRLFVLRDTHGAWQLIAEAPPDGAGHAGGAGGSNSSTFRPRWTDDSKRPIVIETTSTDWNWSNWNKDEPIMPNLETHRDGILMGADRSVRWTSGTYVIAKEGDTLESIAAAVGSWADERVYPRTFNHRNQAEKAALGLIRSINPSTTDKKLEPGVHIAVPDETVLANLIRDLRASKPEIPPPAR